MTWFTAILENVKIAWDHSAIKTETTDYTEKHQHIKYSAIVRYNSQQACVMLVVSAQINIATAQNNYCYIHTSRNISAPADF